MGSCVSACHRQFLEIERPYYSIGILSSLPLTTYYRVCHQRDQYRFEGNNSLKKTASTFLLCSRYHLLRAQNRNLADVPVWDRTTISSSRMGQSPVTVSITFGGVRPEYFEAKSPFSTGINGQTGKRAVRYCPLVIHVCLQCVTADLLLRARAAAGFFVARGPQMRIDPFELARNRNHQDCFFLLFWNTICRTHPKRTIHGDSGLQKSIPRMLTSASRGIGCLRVRGVRCLTILAISFLGRKQSRVYFPPMSAYRLS